MIKIHKKFNKGFTIIETLVALSIFSISVTALIVISGQGISNTSSASNRVVADYLAQEGVEIIRNVRDDALIAIISKKNSSAWAEFLSEETPYKVAAKPTNGINDCISPKNCHVQFISGVPYISPCPSNICKELLYDSATGVYGYVSGSVTFFKRTIKITSLQNDEIRVDSDVSWGNGSQSVSYSQDLFNWPLP